MARKRKMKVYHGVPKSTTDEHTVLYASFDGKTPRANTYVGETYKDSPTGYGIIFPTIRDNLTGLNRLPVNSVGNVFTIDLWAILSQVVSSSYSGRLFILYFKRSDGSTYNAYIERDSSTHKFHVWSTEGQCNLVFGDFDFTSTNLNKPHHLRLVLTAGRYSRFYLDGKEVPTTLYQNVLPADIVELMSCDVGGKNFVLADLHISNIDRGDYFPTLPQDFIDGRSVVTSRMRQQQLKGDPMHSQSVVLRVPNQTYDEIGTIYQRDPDSEGLNCCFDHPELSAAEAYHWHPNAGKVRIRGLNGEIIGGVFNTNMALAKVTKVISSSKYVLSTVQGLVAGDIIRFFISTSSSPECEIKSVDASTNTITLINPPASWEVLPHYFVIETTSLSSSPLVRTQDGYVVQGKWSGLGTTSATFTLGANPSLTDKDLYVEYSLTMPYGNSDFPELPHTTDRAWTETGVEMKPVSSVDIADDFRGKIPNSTRECPHKLSYIPYGSTSLTELRSPEKFQEVTLHSNYTKVSYLDGTTESVVAGTSGDIPQQLLSFNLIDIIERKLGSEIPSKDKVEWVNTNVASVVFNAYAKGECPTGAFVQLNVYKHNVGWVDNIHNTASSIQKLSWSNIIYDGRVSSDGFIHFLLSSKPSNGAKSSSIDLDYASILVALKTDSTFTTLYCDNKRAREDKCNPVLVQKETKTVKRYLPSKECFTTECTKLPYKDLAKVENGEIMALLPYKVVTTCGTAKFTTGAGGVNYYDDKIILPSGYNSYNFDSSPIGVSEFDQASLVSHTVQLPILRYWGGKRYHGVGSVSKGLDSCQTMTSATDAESTPQYEIYAGLKNIDGQLVMVLRTDVRCPNNSVPPSTFTNIDYTLPNRPLIK